MLFRYWIADIQFYVIFATAWRNVIEKSQESNFQHQESSIKHPESSIQNPASSITIPPTPLQATVVGEDRNKIHPN